MSEIKSLAAKLLEVQKEVGAVMKDKKNPHFKNTYADINTFIETVKPVLSKHGVVLLQPLAVIEGTPAISTILMDGETGEKIEYTTPIPQNPDPQKQGSAVSYFRRYALQSMLFLQAEDDDGNAAAQPKANGDTLKTKKARIHKLMQELGEEQYSADDIELHTGLAPEPKNYNVIISMLNEKVEHAHRSTDTGNPEAQ